MRDYGRGRVPNFGVSNDRFRLAVTRDFEARFREALRKRLYPQTPLHLKQIARAIGRSENTVARWWRGETRILAIDLYRLAQFLVGRGDREFLQDIFLDLVPVAALPDNLTKSVLELVRQALDAAGRTGDVGPEAHSWLLPNGDMVAAATGHANYVHGALRIPSTSGDLAAYAMRVLGWVAVTERADHVVVIRHDGRRIAPIAAERICEWLEDRAETIVRVCRNIHMDGAWIAASHEGARAAATAIAKAAFIVRVPRRPWVVKPLPLDDVTDARLKALLEVHRQQPEELVRAAASMGAFTTSSLFGIRGNDVVSHYVGTDLGFDPRSVEGFNVLSRPDTEYAVMLQARILRTKREGAAYNELSGTIDAFNVRYLNLTLPEPGANGRVLTSSVVIERERIAA